MVKPPPQQRLHTWRDHAPAAVPAYLGRSGLGYATPLDHTMTDTPTNPTVRLATAARLAALCALALGCHLDRLLSTPGGGTGPHLAFSQQPSTTAMGTPISVRIVAEDSSGQPSSTFNDAVTVGLGANPTGAALSGTRTV